MAFIKLGEMIEVSHDTVKTAHQIAEDSAILGKFKKFAEQLKKEFPKANDFLYFTAIMMHAAEASALDDHGNIKIGRDGSPVKVGWAGTPGGGVKWVSSDPNITPYRNANRDIFPESELKVAYKKWVHKPLCLDHQSSSVDHVRGLIVDTYYDEKHKRVIALCALDKVTYPDLARKVSTGYTTSVSMGTGVGRAVCTDCGKVARVESDYCTHMSNKSCYGEINLDLSPIELSLVVNGADPAAKIKTVIARDLSKTAQHMADYVSSKLDSGTVSKSDLDGIKRDLSDLLDRVEILSGEKTSSEYDNEEEKIDVSPTSSALYMNDEVETSDLPLQTPPEPMATWANVIGELKALINKTARDVEVLSMRNETMAKKQAYYQGTEEPGKRKYPVDPLNESLRNNSDKHMVGQSPFPNVGPVDGLHPGNSSSKESEVALKKRLQRMASQQERHMKRVSAMKNILKSSYHQGTEEPKKYPVDPLNENTRNKHDKQMVGKAPFPNVGPTDGLYPGDEKLKQLLSRGGKLSARFVKVMDDYGRLNKSASRWDVYSGDMVALSLTVDQITNGRSEHLFDSIHSKKFAQNLLKKINTAGISDVRAMFKVAQEPAKAAPGTAEMAAPAQVPAAPMAPMDQAMDVGLEGDLGGEMGELEDPGTPAEIVTKLRDAADDTARYIADLEQALGGLESEAPALDGVAPAPVEQFNPDLPATLASLNRMRKTLNGGLKSKIASLIVENRNAKEELDTSIHLYRTKYASLPRNTKAYVNQLTAEALKNAKAKSSESISALQSFCLYASGTSNIKKRAAAMKRAKFAQAEKGGPTFGEEKPLPMPTGELPEGTKGKNLLDTNSSDDKKSDSKSRDPRIDKRHYDRIEKSKAEKSKKDSAKDMMESLVGAWHGDKNKADDVEFDETEGWSSTKTEKSDDSSASVEDILGGLDLGPTDPGPWGGDLDSADDGKGTEVEVNGQSLNLAPGSAVPAGAKLKGTASETFDLSSRAGRTAWRAKLAQKGVQFSDLLQKAHPAGSPTLGGLEGKPDAKIETLQDTNKRMLEVATAPVKVQKAAAKIAKYIEEGRISVGDLNGLVAQGLDQAAVDYYKKYWAQAGDPKANEFAAKLTSGVDKEKKAKAEVDYKVRIKRAYALANDMKDRGIITEADFDRQVDEILTWNDEAYASTSKMVAKVASVKSHSMPQVGFMSSSDIMLPEASMKKEASSVDLKAEFDSIFNSSRSLKFSR